MRTHQQSLVELSRVEYHESCRIKSVDTAVLSWLVELQESEMTTGILRQEMNEEKLVI